MIFSPTMLPRENKLNMRIAKVVEVSYYTGAMRVKYLDVLNAPSVSAQAHYAPRVETAYLSARYFMVGEMVLVVTTSTQNYVLVDVQSAQTGGTQRDIVGSDIEHSDWFNLMHKATWAVFGQATGIQTQKMVADDGQVYQFNDENSGDILDEYINGMGNFHPCHWIYPFRGGTSAFPVFVVPNDPIVILEDWTWVRGEPNYIGKADRDLDWQYHQVTGDPQRQPSWRSQTQNTCLLPTPDIAIKLETQASSDVPYHLSNGNYTADGSNIQPGIQFFVYPPDIRHNEGVIAHTDNNDIIELLFTIERPWATVAEPNTHWTNNWFPPMFKSPVQHENFSVLHFGWTDYVKGDNDNNIITFVEGQIKATPKASSIGKEHLSFNDYDLTHQHTTRTETSEYQLKLTDTGSISDTYREGNRLIEMEPNQYFTVCSDGINTLKKVPRLTYSEFKSRLYEGGEPVGELTHIWDFDLEIDHEINGIIAFTSKLHVNNNGTVKSGRIYYIQSVDLTNKLIIADVYIVDIPAGVSKVERVIVDGNSGSEYVIWSYEPNTLQNGTAKNIPPWLGSLTFPPHPYNSFTGSRVLEHTEIQWLQPYYEAAYIWTQTTECSGTQPSGVYGTNFPLSLDDEDIHSILLMIQRKSDGVSMLTDSEYAWAKPRVDGWMAFGSCCFSLNYGVLTYPYNRPHIKKVNGVVSAAEELYTGTVETINRVY